MTLITPIQGELIPIQLILQYTGIQNCKGITIFYSFFFFVSLGTDWLTDVLHTSRAMNIACTIRTMYTSMHRMRWPICGPISRLACSTTSKIAFMRKYPNHASIYTMANRQIGKWRIRCHTIWEIRVSILNALWWLSAVSYGAVDSLTHHRI